MELLETRHHNCKNVHIYESDAITPQYDLQHNGKTYDFAVASKNKQDAVQMAAYYLGEGKDSIIVKTHWAYRVFIHGDC